MVDRSGAVALPLVEKGYVRSSSDWWSFDDTEHVPELRWPLSVDVYDRMRSDAQVMSVIRAVVLPIVRTKWKINPNGARDEVVEFVARDLGLPIAGADLPLPAQRRRGRFSWDEHLRTAMLALTFGHSYFEQLARTTDDGKHHLAKLSPRLPRSISAVNVDSDGGLISIEQYAASKPIPVSQLVAYVHEKEGGNWFGRSLLRAAWKFWILKDRALRTQAQTLERNGMGVPRYTGAEDEDDLSAGQAIAEAWRSGPNAAASIPFGAELDLVGVTGTLPDADIPIRYYDEQIARAVLAHFLNLGSQTGSWALGSTFADFFTLSLQGVAEQVRDTSTMHVVEDIVDWNWGIDEGAPEIVFDEIGTRDALTALAVGGPAAKQAVESLGALVRAGFEPAAAAKALGLPPIEHTGLVPVTVQGEAVAEGDTP